MPKVQDDGSDEPQATVASQRILVGTSPMELQEYEEDRQHAPTRTGSDDPEAVPDEDSGFKHVAIPQIHQHSDTLHQPQGSRSLMKKVFGIGPEDKESGQPKSALILPLSNFGVNWIFLTSLFLGYTAIVTPWMVSFYWLEQECDPLPTLPIDIVLDCFFIIDIFVHFNTAIMVNGELVDKRWLVAKSYLQGWFIFDVATSIPVSFVELAVLARCDGPSPSPEESTDSSSNGMRLMRTLKPLRWLKLARILKLTKGGNNIIDTGMDYFNISPKQSKTANILVTLLFSIHAVACMFWLWKIMGYSLDGDGLETMRIKQFLDDQTWNTREGYDPRDELETAAGKFQAYFICVYVTTMTLTTVGYGDISAENTAERIGYVLLFVVGAFVWGNLMADVGDLHTSSSQREKEKMEKLQRVLDFLVDNDCPRKLRYKIIQYTRFREDHLDDQAVKKEIVNELPANLQKGLVRHLYSRVVSRLPLFSYIERVDNDNEANDAIQETFLNNIFILLKYQTFSPGELLVDFSDPADDVLIFTEGKVFVGEAPRPRE